MMKNKEYSNGQKTFEQTGKELAYFFKNGKIKAKGISINGIMEGEWKFYRETGQLWQVGNFQEGQKHGSWVRYDKKDKLEYQETFVNGKLVKSK
jgi:antitoxin component YwqK of YwqJK toxin-antitoxin module